MENFRVWNQTMFTGGGYYPPKNDQPLIFADNVRSPDTLSFCPLQPVDSWISCPQKKKREFPPAIKRNYAPVGRSVTAFQFFFFRQNSKPSAPSANSAHVDGSGMALGSSLADSEISFPD